MLNLSIKLSTSSYTSGNEGEIELYNLKEDLKESANKATKKPEVAQALLKNLTDWRKANSVPLPPSSILDF